MQTRGPASNDFPLPALWNNAPLVKALFSVQKQLIGAILEHACMSALHIEKKLLVSASGLPH